MVLFNPTGKHFERKPPHSYYAVAIAVNLYCLFY